MNINELEILRLLNGDASDDLDSKINNWINASETNKAEFKLYEAIWKSTSQIPELKEFDLEDEWSAIEEKISTSDKTSHINTTHVISLKSHSKSSFFRQQG